MQNRSGFSRPNLSGEMAYTSFVPAPLPPVPDIALTSTLTAALVEANRHLTLLNGLAERIPSVSQLVAMYVRKEAVLSSQIEGTQASLEDILDPSIPENASLDVEEVVGYIRATEFAIARMQGLPLCNRLIRETHAVLMAGQRGQDKNPGEFRHSQNWIGGAGSTLKTARYIPPNVEDMQSGMAALEAYYHQDDGQDELIRAALIHYQFESIHPFLDGNGRIGRLLITLYLMARGRLSTPALYISYFLKRNRLEYYDRLSAIRANGDYEQWVTFFLTAVADSARDAITTIDRLVALHAHNTERITTSLLRSTTALRLLSYLEQHPMMVIGRAAEAMHLSYNATAKATDALCTIGILTQRDTNKRNRVFVYAEYLAVLSEGTRVDIS